MIPRPDDSVTRRDPLPATETPSDLARLADLATEAGLPAFARQALELTRRTSGAGSVAACHTWCEEKAWLATAPTAPR
jgi:hypothetical protein